MTSTSPLGRPGAGGPALGLVAWAGLALLACATPQSYEMVEQKLQSAGRSVPGLGSDFVVVPIHADSQVAAWTLIAEARGGSPLGERLSHDLRRSAQRGVGVVVGGPYSDLTRLVLLDALDLAGPRSLAGLTLVYVGERQYARELHLAAGSRSARFYHRDLR